MNAKDAGHSTGIHFVGMLWLRMIVHGIVKYAKNAKTGENGTVKIVINVLME